MSVSVPRSLGRRIQDGILRRELPRTVSFDNWMSKAKAGLLIPTTGFAHSVSSSALDYKKEGLITGLGSNFFKLAGSVILYGILSAFILVIVRVIIGG